MKITKIEALRLNLPPLKNPSKPKRPGVDGGPPHPIHIYPEFKRTRNSGIPGELGPEMWVRVTADSGDWGLGHSHWGDLAAPVIRHVYAKLLEGRDPFAIEFLNDLMWRGSLRFGAHGIPSAAMAAIDMALWDLKGKVLKQPVYSLLGGPCRDHLDYYATTTDYEWAKELGFKNFKIQNLAHYTDGTAGINRVVEEVHQAREAVGPDADLMINPVMSFNVEYAARLMERLKPFNLRWFEEPLAPWNIEGLVELKRAVPTMPLATGETHRGRHVFREMIERRCVDLVQPDMRWTGGLTECVKIYTIAEAAGVATIIHGGGMMAPGQHFGLAFPEHPLAEWVIFPAPGIPLEEAVRTPGVPIPKNGRVVPSNAPGFGFEILPDQLSAW